jgi:hypothetical protein
MVIFPISGNAIILNPSGKTGMTICGITVSGTGWLIQGLLLLLRHGIVRTSFHRGKNEIRFK